MSLYSPPVGAGADSERVEQRLSEDDPVEQAVDGAALTRHPYRVIRGRRDGVVIGGEAKTKAGDADVPGVDDEGGLDVWNDPERQSAGDVGLIVDELCHVRVRRDDRQREATS